MNYTENWTVTRTENWNSRIFQLCYSREVWSTKSSSWKNFQRGKVSTLSKERERERTDTTGPDRDFRFPRKILCITCCSYGAYVFCSASQMRRIAATLLQVSTINFHEFSIVLTPRKLHLQKSVDTRISFAFRNVDLLSTINRTSLRSDADILTEQPAIVIKLRELNRTLSRLFAREFPRGPKQMVSDTLLSPLRS